MSAIFKEPLEQFAASVLEQLAYVVAGPASTLRDGTEHRGVELPRDLYAHEGAQTEWWYYTGHMRTARGRRFGFELVFFKRRTDLDRFGVVPLRLIANPLHLAHFAITDEWRSTFRYEHRKSAGGVFDMPARASQQKYDLRLGNWSVREHDGAHILRATLGRDLIFEARLKNSKPSRYFSFTRMEAEGRITWHGETEDFTGAAWMDREFGTWRTTENQKGWDWFSLQLSTGAEVMVYHLRNRAGEPSPFSSGTYVDASGRGTHLKREDFILEATAHWRSPRSQAVYPSGWRLKVPRFGLDVTITPVMQDQELDTRGTTMIVYWEGACRVHGRHGNEEAAGRAYAELVGYDLSHEQPSLSTFLFGGALAGPWRSIFG